MNKEFSAWTKWQKRNSLNDIEFPGVYAIALSEKDISEKLFSWCSEIIYIGMTNAKGGLKSRLGQFENTIIGKDGHGGAVRVHFKYPYYNKLVPNLYVSVCPHKCNVQSNNPIDLRIMGDVAKFEYECFAIFVENFGKLPEFNDKKLSPKK